jgi:hypothetical protein
VSRDDSRDRAIEAVLRKRAVPLSASAACLDAETMAAWVDGGLDGQARARAERHMASCARCQSMMASIVNSTAPVSVDRAWWRLNVRWLMPLAGAATAALLWMVVPATGPEQSALLDDGANVQSREVPAPAAPPPAPDPSAAPKVTDEKLARAEPAGRRAAPQESLEERKSTDPARANRERDQRGVDLMAKAEDRSTPVAGVTATPSRRQEPAAAEADRPATVPEAAAPPPAAQAFGAAVEVRSQDSSVRWRIAGPGVVERSTDGGSSWERLETGTRTTVADGSCPSQAVCWLVGPAGVVLLTTDARSWRQTALPSSEDLVAVDASSDRVAVVRTATGRSFRTADGGATWTQL